MDRNNQKVIVIGLDGATFDIIKPLIKEGKLPYLASLMKKGVSAPLKSTVMPNSFPAWVSCTTGVNPGKHGIFWSLIRRENNSYPLALMSSLDIKAKRLWQLLSNRGYRVGVVNLPTEYPPEKVNGFMVCGALTPSMESEFTYPETLKKEILTEIPDYQCEVDFARINLKELAEQSIQSIENHEKLILYLMESKPWDLFFSVFTETDTVQHKYWAGIDGKHPDHRRLKRKFGTFVYQVYERLDQAVGKILSGLSKETVVFIISDHGFGPCYQSFSLSRWLVEKKYLVLKDSPVRIGLKKVLQNARMLNKAKRMRQYLLYFISSSRRKRGVRYLREKQALAGRQLINKIDWEQTKAYFTGDQGIRLNLKGREPQGIVSPGPEADRLKEDIKRQLKALYYSNGQPVFEAVMTGEEAFSGPFRDKAPDLIVPINHSQAPPRPEKWDFTAIHPEMSGTHSPLGVFIAAGPGIKAGTSIKAPNIMDITPTILYILKEPLTREMDGRVLTEIFTPWFCRRRQIVKEGSSLRPQSGNGVDLTEDESKIERRLRSLGYID